MPHDEFPGKPLMEKKMTEIEEGELIAETLDEVPSNQEIDDCQVYETTMDNGLCEDEEDRQAQSGHAEGS